MKKYYLALPLLLTISALSGCGGNKEEGLVVEFWHTFGDKPETALQNKANQFEQLVKENEGVDVKIELVYQGAYKDVPTKVNNGIRDGQLPTMCVAYPDHVANYMDYEEGNAGKYVVNLDKFINDPEITFGTDRYLGDTEDTEDIVASYLEEGRQMQREGTYVLPYMKSTEIMIYNLDIATDVVPKVFTSVEKTSAKVEEFMRTITWEQLMQLAKYIVEHKSDYTSVEYPVFYDSDSNFFITELYQRGIGYSSIGQGGVGTIDFETGENNSKAKNMVSELNEQHKKGYLTTKGTEGTYASNNFKEGKTVFTIGSTGGTGYTIPSSDDFQVGFAKVPVMGNDKTKQKYISQGPSVCFLHNPSLSEDVNNEKLSYAWKFMKYIMSKEVNTELCIDGSEGYSPVRNSCYTTETYSDFVESKTSYANAALITQNDIAGNYYSSAVFPGSSELRDQVGAIITSVFSGKASIDDAFAAAISNTKKFIK